MRRLLVALFLLCGLAPASAKLTQADVQTTISTDILSCGDQCITAQVLRYVLSQMNTATFQYAPPWAVNAQNAPFNVQCDESTDHTAGIQAAINFVGTSTVYKVVQLPSGTCKYSTLSITANGVVLQGQGHGNTKLQTTSASADAISVGSATESAGIQGVQLIGFTMNSAVSRNGGAAIHKYASS